MHITLESDYAIRIVLHLAKENKRCDANNISAATGVSLRFSLKILRNLVASGITKSFKGALGGYELNMPIEQITLRLILEAIEGTYVFSRCLAKNGEPCTNPTHVTCKVQQIFNDISNTVTEKLEQVSIKDLIH